MFFFNHTGVFVPPAFDLVHGTNNTTHRHLRDLYNPRNDSDPEMIPYPKMISDDLR